MNGKNGWHVVLALEPAEDDPLDKVALGKEEEDDHGQDHGRGSRHEQVPAGAHDAAEGGQADGHREFLRRVQVEQRPNEVIPAVEKGARCCVTRMSQSHGCVLPHDKILLKDRTLPHE